VPNVLATEEKLANLISDSIRQRLVPEIEILPWWNLDVIAVQVFPSNNGRTIWNGGERSTAFSFVLAPRQPKGGCGTDSRTKNVRRLGSFDEQAVPELNSEVIDFRAASELLAPNKKVQAQTWTNLRVTNEHQHKLVPTIGGLLLFGKDRFAHFPDS
jgi:ATP-dependent DNA helicase RecG